MYPFSTTAAIPIGMLVPETGLFGFGPTQLHSFGKGIK